METQAAPQPTYIMQSGKSSVSAGTIIAGAGAILVVGYFGKKAWDKYKAGQEAGKLDTPAAQIAAEIYGAKHWYGNTPQVAFDAAKEIASKKIPFKEVTDSFAAAGWGNINDYLEYLGAEGKAQFFNIVNLAKPTEPGKPPTLSSLKYDDVKNINFLVAKVTTVIRKSPELIGSLSITDVLSKSNIVSAAQPGKHLGLFTGKYQISKDGKTGFLEYWAFISDGKTATPQRVWVAGANVDFVSFSRSTQKAESDKYIKDSHFTLIDISTYNKAVSA